MYESEEGTVLPRVCFGDEVASKTVVIVDDDPSLLRALRRAMSRPRLRIGTFTTTNAAYRWLLYGGAADAVICGDVLGDGDFLRQVASLLVGAVLIRYTSRQAEQATDCYERVLKPSQPRALLDCVASRLHLRSL